MRTFEQLAPAHARFIHDLMFIITRINVKPSFSGGPKFFWPGPATGNRGRLLSLLDKPKAAVNYSHSR
jgi:hypothetical protein